MTRDLSPFRVNTHELPRRAGEMKEHKKKIEVAFQKAKSKLGLG